MPLTGGTINSSGPGVALAEFPSASTTTTISSDGALTITSKWHAVRGYGSANDTVTSIVVDAQMIGKIICLEAGGSEDITFTGALLGRSVDFTLNADGDQLYVRVVAANTLKMGSTETAGA